MKKKILSTLLAVCLFVGVAIPAVFAASSDAAGDAKKVSKITIKENSYDIKAGDTKDFADQIAVYESESKLVLDHGHIQYSILANTGDSSDFTIVGSKVTAHKVGATATLTVFDNYSEKARTTVTIKAVAPTADVTRKVESFTFEKSLLTLPVSDANPTIAEDMEFVVESHPKGTKFTTEDIAKVDALMKTYFETGRTEVKDGDKVTVTKVDAFIGAAALKADKDGKISKLNDDKNKLTYTIDKAVLTSKPNGKDMNKNHALEIIGANFVNGKDFKASTAIRYVDAVKATGIYIPQNVTVKVGEKVELPKVTYYPTNANVGKKVDWAIDAYLNDGNAYQYAVVDGDDLLGVNSNAPAKARLRAILTHDTKTTATTECIVEVKPATWTGKVTPQISKASGEMKVGDFMALEVINMPKDVTVAWSFDSKTAGIVDFAPWKGNNTKVYAKKAGTVDVKATLSNGEVYKTTIVIKAADAAKPADPAKPGTGKPTTNPQTGDSLFANLF